MALDKFIPEKFRPYRHYVYIVAIIGIISVGAFGYYDMTKPAKGTPLFGVCRTFIETHIQYPHTLNITQVVQGRDYVEIYASFINAHGMRPTSVYRCNFELTNQGILLDEIIIDFEKINDEITRRFNQNVPFLLKSKDVDLTLPNWEGMSLENLKP